MIVLRQNCCDLDNFHIEFCDQPMNNHTFVKFKVYLTKLEPINFASAGVTKVELFFKSSSDFV